jgi:hypothetical protein
VQSLLCSAVLLRADNVVGEPGFVLMPLCPEKQNARQARSRSKDLSIKELVDEAFADLLKKHKQPVGLKAALEESGKKRPQKR